MHPRISKYKGRKCLFLNKLGLWEEGIVLRKIHKKEQPLLLLNIFPDYSVFKVKHCNGESKVDSLNIRFLEQ